jgi:transposase
MTQVSTAIADAGREDGTISVALELSKARWLVGIALPRSSKISRYGVTGGDTAGLLKLLQAARAKAAQLGFSEARVVSCYEAGYDGFWLDRWLKQHGVNNRVLDPASIEVDRRARRAKTDRIDLDKLMRVQCALDRGEPRACSVVRVPSVAEEDAKRPHRERQFRVRERVRHVNRIKGLLSKEGVRGLDPGRPDFVRRLSAATTPDGRGLPPHLLAELRREHQSLRLAIAQIAELEAEERARITAPRGDPNTAKIANLIGLRGIGLASAVPLVREAFYRAVNNRRQVGCYFGLTGTPYCSGAMAREQGISKAGNPRARGIAIELAWLWLRHQPDSELSRWYRVRVAGQQGGARKSAIVALARKLMIGLWRYLETGLVPTGAVLRPVR